LIIVLLFVSTLIIRDQVHENLRKRRREKRRKLNKMYYPNKEMD
jgi:hypothetical protein